MQIVLRAGALFLFVWVVMRAMGRKELSELSAFDLILLIVMGDLIQQGVTGDDRSVTGAALAVATMGLLTVAFSYVSFRWRRAQTLLEGIPVVIVEDGKPFMEVLRVERLTLDEVRDAARAQGIADLRDVRIGVLEASGRFSFVTKTEARTPHPQERQSP